MTKVSIIVPVYNVEKYLEECLKSLINQTLKDIEIICVNDGSTDNSLNILKEYSKLDSRIKIIDKANSGYGNSMNRGLDFATGEFIGIVESDDFIEKDMYESLYNLAVSNNCDIAKCDWYNYWTKDNIKEKSSKVSQHKCNTVIHPAEYPEILTIQPSVWSAIYKHQLIKDNNIRFLETAGASYQDTSFSFKVFALAQKVIFTEKAFLYYRQDNESSSINNKTKVFAICEEYKEIDKFINTNADAKKHFNTAKLLNQYKAYIWTLKRIAPEYRKEFLDEFSKEFDEYYKNELVTVEFIKKIGKKNFDTLINNKEDFIKNFEKKMQREKWKKLRSNIISIKINSSRCCIKLFGKQILNI